MGAPKRRSFRVNYTIQKAADAYDPKKAQAEAKARRDAANKDQEAAHRRLAAQQKAQKEALRKKGKK